METPPLDEGPDEATFGGRLQLFQEAVSPGNVSAFANALGVSRSAVYAWFKLEAPNHMAVGAVAMAYPESVRLDWLLEGTGAMFAETSSADVEAKTHTALVTYPLRQGFSNGTGRFVKMPPELIAGLTAGRVPPEDRAYWTRVRGVAMEPWLPEGSPAFVEVMGEIADAGRYVIRIDDGPEVVRRFEPLGGGVLLMIADNPAHANRRLRRAEGGGEEGYYMDDEHGVRLHLTVCGRVVYPLDTAQAISTTIAHYVGKQK